MKKTNYMTIALVLACAGMLVALFRTKNNDVKDEQRQLDNDLLAKRQSNEIAELRENIRFYVEREKGFIEKIAVLTNTVDSLNDVIYDINHKPKTHEKSTIISDSKSAFYTKFLTDRYSTK
jgi:hypothetical protein